MVASGMAYDRLARARLTRVLNDPSAPRTPEGACVESDRLPAVSRHDLAGRGGPWTTSVCTGSLLLGAAGILHGKRATSHWILRDMLPQFGAEPVAERVVIEGKVITAAGVSAGIDMALHLAAMEAGEDEARALQLVIEYDPDPPFVPARSTRPIPRRSNARPRTWCRAARKRRRRHD